MSRVEPVEFGNPFEPAHRGWITKERTGPGHIGDPRYATAAKGEALLSVFAADVAAVSFGECRFAVLPNCDPYARHRPELTAALLTRQITSPVRWRETIEEMARLGVDTVVELGPKRVLSGLIRRIDAGLRLLNVEDAESLAKTVAALNT